MNRTPSERLSLIAKHYLDDQPALNQARQIADRRRASIPGIQAILQPFVAGAITLDEMRQQLDLYLRRPENDAWGTTGFWMMTLNQLANHHGDQGAAHLRQTLDGLDHTNVAERFEAFERFLRDEKQRLGLGLKLAAPGRSPFFIALFARWLDPGHDVLVPWPSLRRGLKALNDVAALPHTAGLRFSGDEAQIANVADFAAAQEAIAAIETAVPALATSSEYGDERFLAWVDQHRQQIRAWVEGVTVAFPDEPLAAISPDRLRERIQRLRRELLVPEDAITRIYEALVLGQHVILSGPPGTGKTRLAALLPRVLWMGDAAVGAAPTFMTASGSHINTAPTTNTSYAVQIATATDEWTPRHVIGGIVPTLDDSGEGVRYEIAPGCLMEAILENWEADPQSPDTWQDAQRRRPRATWEGALEEYRGLWLVIDEFNRAPIDLALGEALTAIGGGQSQLTVPTRQGARRLPIPKDFRIIGTLNTFDRHFLNQMSEALKRRFVFIEILPPDRHERAAEQGTVLRETLRRLPKVAWHTLDAIVAVNEGQGATPWEIEWRDSGVRAIFEEGWRLFEVIRVYRQFGTAQAIAWCAAFLGAGLLRRLDPGGGAEWRRCLSGAFADTLADQLQILFPDEIEVLLAYGRSATAEEFAERYNRILRGVTSLKRRNAQMLALRSIKQPPPADESYLAAEQAREIVENEEAQVPADVLTALFHAGEPRARLPEFEDRLERFLFERTI